MINPGHALRYTKGNDRKNIPPKPVLPSKDDMPILRRAAAGYIVVTMVDGAPRYAYDDGSLVTLRGLRGKDFGRRHFQRLVKEGWLVADRGDSLLPDDPNPQIYRARKL